MRKPKRRDAEPLRITVTGKNMPITEPLRSYVERKMSRLGRYLDRLSQITVALSNDNVREAGQRNVAEATATARGRVLRAQVAEADMYAAVDALADKLHLQLTRLKERRHPHRTGLSEEETSMLEPLTDISDSSADEIVSDGEADQGDRRIVRLKQFIMKPMFSDEAIEELEALDHAFYVFLNAESEQINVLYRRHDGSYGLIEPSAH